MSNSRSFLKGRETEYVKYELVGAEAARVDSHLSEHPRDALGSEQGTEEEIEKDHLDKLLCAKDLCDWTRHSAIRY